MRNHSSSPWNVPGNLQLSLDERQLAAARAIVKDNQGALCTVMLAVDLHTAYDAELRGDLVRIFLEQEGIPTSMLSNTFALSGRQLWEIYAADPISLFACLDCDEPLPVRDRRSLARLRRAAKAISVERAGNLVDADLLCQLLCEGCTRTRLYHYNEECRLRRLSVQARAAQLRKMPFEKYRKTPEWQARRNAALERAGFRCQTCGACDKRLDVHHNSYARYGSESVFDLVVLCARCHVLFHGPRSDAA